MRTVAHTSETSFYCAAWARSRLRLALSFGAPAEDTRQDAELVVRLLCLNPSRALPLARLQNPEREAARRLVAGHAAKVHEGLLAAPGIPVSHERDAAAPPRHAR